MENIFPCNDSVEMIKSFRTPIQVLSNLSKFRSNLYVFTICFTGRHLSGVTEGVGAETDVSLMNTTFQRTS
jgi:hypothetical protein